MKQLRLGMIMNGVSGRMGHNQHLVRSILSIRDQGGVEMSDGNTVMPDPILVGRSAAKVSELAKTYAIERWTDDLEEALKNPEDRLFFDAGTTLNRGNLLKKAIVAGKDIYCEKPVSSNLQEALEVYELAQETGVKHGVVQDKLWLPGIQKLKFLRDSGFFGRILSVRGEFGYWVFEGDLQPAQRPSWNYRKEQGGGVILDMLSHWRYVLDNIIAPVKAVSCIGAQHISERWDENGAKYIGKADDAAYATFELEGEIIAHFNSSWCVRVRRDDLLTLQVDGTHGSAVAGLRNCWTQSRVNTPKPVWNPDVPSTIDYWENWDRVPDTVNYDNAFKAQWELFIRHLYEDTPFRWNLLEGAKGVQLAELGLKSWSQRRWLEVEDLGAERP